MRGFKLTADHELELANGSFVFLEDGPTATAQEAKTRLLFFRGEWFRDVREGVPYLQELFAKGVTTDKIRSTVRQTLLSVPSVADVPRVDVTFDRAARQARVDWEARTLDGATVRSEDFPPLILEI